jgi:succinate dehydrogenase / fumarate reductase, cytochrome b subunit
MTDASRPLSPHLQVYRFTYTMATSIFHRATGIVLVLGFLSLVGALLALASGPEAYAVVYDFGSGWFGRLLVAGLLAAFWYHTFAGLRHLAFDAGIGLDKGAARRSATWLFAATAVAALLSAYAVFAGGVRP